MSHRNANAERNSEDSSRTGQELLAKLKQKNKTFIIKNSTYNYFNNIMNNENSEHSENTGRTPHSPNSQHTELLHVNKKVSDSSDSMTAQEPGNLKKRTKTSCDIKLPKKENLLNCSFNKSYTSKKATVTVSAIKKEDKIIKKYIKGFMYKMSNDFKNLEENLPFKNRRKASVETATKKGNNAQEKIFKRRPLTMNAFTQGMQNKISLTLLNRNDTFRGNTFSNENSIHKSNDLKVNSSSIKEQEDSQEKRSLKNFENVYDSFSDEEIAEELETHSFQIDSKSIFKKIWDKIMICLIAYSVTVVPFRLSVEGDADSSVAFQYVEVLVDCVFLMDIVCNFITPFHDENEVLVTNPRKIAKDYFLSWFLMDLVSSVPTGILTLFFNIDEYNYNTDSYVAIKKILDLSKLSRFVKWFKIFRLMTIVKNDEKGRILADLQLNMNSSLNRIVKFLILLLILIHISSCIWIFIAKSYATNENWVTYTGLNDVDNFSLYISSLYFNLVTIFTIGFGDITARNYVERLYNILFMSFGVLLFSFTISSLSTFFIQNIDPKELEMQTKLKLLQEIQAEHRTRFPEKLFKKIWKTVRHSLNRQHLLQYQLLESLPTYFRNQLVVIMHKTHIKDLMFFRHQPHDFILFVLPLLKPIKVTKGDVLFSVGDFVDEMYMVVRGHLSLHLNNLFDYMEVATINSNFHFGEILMYMNEQSPYVLKCKSNVADLLVLRKNDITNIKMSFNENLLKIMKRSLNLLEEVDKRKRMIEILHKYENSELEIKSKINLVSTFLLKKDFDDFYNKGMPLEDVSDFVLSQKDHKFIAKLFDSNYNSDVINSDSFFNKKNSENITVNKIPNNIKNENIVFTPNISNQLKKGLNSNHKNKGKRPININVFQYDNTYNQKFYITDAIDSPTKKAKTRSSFEYCVIQSNSEFSLVRAPAFTSDSQIHNKSICPFSFEIKREKSLCLKRKNSLAITKICSFEFLRAKKNSKGNLIVSKHSVVSYASSKNGLFSNLKFSDKKHKDKEEVGNSSSSYDSDKNVLSESLNKQYLSEAERESIKKLSLARRKNKIASQSFLNKVNRGLRLNSYLSTDSSALLKSIQEFVGKTEEKKKLEYSSFRKLDKVLEILKKSVKMSPKIIINDM